MQPRKTRLSYRRILLIGLLLIIPILTILPPAVAAPPQQSVHGCSLDLMLVLDGSGSIQSTDFQTMKAFVRQLAASFDIGPTGANIGIIQFADTAELYLPLSEDSDSVFAAIDGMTQFGNRTNIAAGIQLAQSQFVTRRSGIPRVILVLTDGLHNMDGNPIAEADLARIDGTFIFGIAVGGVDISELVSISNGPQNVIAVNTFDGLMVVLDVLVNNTCALLSNPTVNLPATTTPPQNTNPTTSTTPVAPVVVPYGGARATRIAFASDRDGDSEIFVMDADGNNVQQLTHNTSSDDKPAWSKDGTHIAWESNADGDFDIYVMNADGTNPVNITNNNTDDYGPAWSPNNQQIAFHSNRDGDIELYVMQADGSNVEQLTNDTIAIDRSPSWSPDGSQLVYYSDVSGGRELYNIEVAYKRTQRLTENEYYDGQPDWSLNGTQMVFASTRGTTYPEIYLMRVDGTNVMQLTQDAAADDDPVWSPDGTQIAFESDRAGNYDIWAMNLDGTGLVQLTNDPATDWSPDWMWVPQN